VGVIAVPAAFQDIIGEVDEANPATGIPVPVVRIIGMGVPDEGQVPTVDFRLAGGAGNPEYVVGIVVTEITDQSSERGHRPIRRATSPR
jgi:hypothetical protein